MVRPLQGPGKDKGSEIGPIFILGDLMAKVRYDGPETYYTFQGKTGIVYQFTGRDKVSEVRDQEDIELLKNKGGFTVIEDIELGDNKKDRKVK